MCFLGYFGISIGGGIFPMDLKIKDVAELLNISETTIRRWLADGKIPAYRLNHQFRFSRTEIEDWVMSHKMNSSTEDFPFAEVKLDSEKAKNIVGRVGTQQFSLYRAIHRGGTLNDVPGSTKEEVITHAVKQIAGKLHLDSEVLTELLLDRERLMPTSLNQGIAVPHTRDFLLQEAYDIVTVVYPKKPIEYGSLDNRPVHTLFFLFACQDKRHLHLLAKLAHFSSRAENLQFIQIRPKKAELLPFIKSWEADISIPVAETPSEAV